MKKTREKGEPFEELSVVTSAGYDKGKRRDKSINKRAGLHDKKVEDDETRIFRRKPLAIKHKRRLRKAMPALLAVLSIAMVIIASGSYNSGGGFDDLDGDYHTVCYEIPDDGTSPEEHTVVETIGYLNYSLQHEPYWSSSMAQSRSALFNIKQNTYNYKKYYKNNLISVDIAKGASTSAKQFCQTGNVVLWRDAADVNDTNGFNTKWKDGKPSGLTISEFKKKRGLPPAEFSVYVLNENTVLNANDYSVVANGDGTYSITADLDVNTKYGEENNMHSAVYYYKQQMAVTGGLSQLPTYFYTNVTYTFDENYRVLSFEINDSYEATLRIPGLGEVTSPCTSNTKTTFSYEEADCVNSAYDDFKGYVNSYGEAGDEEVAPFTVSATNCLAGAFASVLSDGAVFKLDLGLGGKTVDGVVAVSLKDGGLDNICAKLGNITVHALSEEDGYGLYLALGQNNYQVNLGGIALPVSADGDGDVLGGLLDALLGGDFLYDSESGIATLNSEIELLGITADLNFAFKVDEEKEEISLIDLKATVNYQNISLDATLKFGNEKDKPADLTEADKKLYTDIFNDGVAVGVDLTLGKKVVNGVAKIDFEKGAFTGVRAKLGDITVHYDGANLYIASGENKYKLDISALGGSVPAPAGLNFDLNTLLSGVLEKLVIENGIIKTQLSLTDILPDLSDIINLSEIDISLDLFEGIKVSAYLDNFGGVGVDAYFSSEAIPEKLTDDKKAEYVDILNDGIAVAVNLTLDGKLIKGVAKIDFKDGEFAGIRANLGDAVIHYVDDVIYISVSGSKIKLPVSALSGVDSLSLDGFNLKDFIAGIIGGVNIENGRIKTKVPLEDILPELSDLVIDVSLDLFGGIKADLGFELFGANIKASATLADADKAPDKLTYKEKEEYVDVTDSFTLTGMIDVTLGGEQISLAVNNLAISFENGFGFKLDATLLLNNTYNNFYIEYTNGVLTVTYGAVQPMPISGEEVEYDVITVRLDILGGDLEALEQAIVNVYNRVLAVYNEIAKQNVQAANELSDILDTLGIAKDGVNGMGELLNKLDIPTVDGKLDLKTLLKAIALSSTKDGISATLGNIFAELKLSNSGVNCGASIKLGTSSFDLTVSDVCVQKYFGFEVPCENPLDRDGFTDMLDYLGAAADMLLQHSISVNLEGTLYSTDAAYTDCGNIKYKFNAFLEYDDCGKMPVTYEDGQLFVSNDIYVHFNLALVAQASVDKSLYLDVYILDANPSGTKSGLTTGGYSADGKSLDFYVSVSELAAGAKGYNPLKFYGSMEEVLRIASMGVAMLNLQDINTTSEEVNSAVASIYNLLNGMLIQNYIPSVASQFASLGESLLPNILKTDLSSLLNKLIAEYESVMDGIENKVEITEGNFIKSATCADGQLSVALNSATLFGVPEYEDLTFYITKTTGEHSLISGVGLNNIYFGDNGENKLNLSAGITYGGISKPDSASAFKDYKNFAGLDELLLMGVASATHETTDDERAAGYLADYKLNNDYCVGGDITLKILGNDITITINTLHINIDENNDVSFDINLSYNKEKFWGMASLLTDNATVDISIKNDRVYIKKAIDGGTTSYRVMPVNAFMDDMFNQLTYILSFSSTITKLADQFMSGSTEKIFPTFDDYGDYIDKFITLYEYNVSSSEWNVEVNCDTLNGLAGMSGLKDIKVAIKGDGENLKSLTLSGALSIISFSGTLDYLNPNEKFVDGKSDLSNNVANLAPDGLYLSWTDILGGDTFAEIDKHFKWSELAGGKTGYLSYEGDGLNFCGYTYIGASYQTGNGYAVGTLADIKEKGVAGVKLDAIWMKADIQISKSKNYNLWKVNYTYALGIKSVNIDIKGNDEVISGLKLSAAKAYGYVNNDANFNAYVSNNNQFTPYVENIEFAGGNGSFACGAYNFDMDGFTTSSKSHGHAVVQFILGYNGSTLNTSAHVAEKF